MSLPGPFFVAALGLLITTVRVRLFCQSVNAWNPDIIVAAIQVSLAAWCILWPVHAQFSAASGSWVTTVVASVSSIAWAAPAIRAFAFAVGVGLPGVTLVLAALSLMVAATNYWLNAIKTNGVSIELARVNNEPNSLCVVLVVVHKVDAGVRLIDLMSHKVDETWFMSQALFSPDPDCN